MTVHSIQAPSGAAMASARVLTVLEWFAGFLVLVFAIPAILTDGIGLHHDLYLLVYGSLVIVYVAAFVGHFMPDWRQMLRSHCVWSLGLGGLVAVAAVQNVLGDTSTSHPGGAYFGFELVWRGAVYGVIDALALFVFPAFVAYLLMGRDRRGWLRKLGYAALTLSLTLLVTATYHLGYPQFRSSDLANPETGAVLMSVPAMATGNPIGALVAHPVMHVTAVTHEYFGSDPGYLPPKLTGYPDRLGGTTAWAFAGVWIALLASVLWKWRHEVFGPSPGSRGTPTIT